MFTFEMTFKILYNIPTLCQKILFLQQAEDVSDHTISCDQSIECSKLPYISEIPLKVELVDKTLGESHKTSKGKHMLEHSTGFTDTITQNSVIESTKDLRQDICESPTVTIPNCDLQITTNIETAIPDVETGVPMGMKSTLSAIDSKKHLSIYTNDKIPTQLDIVGPLLSNTVKVEKINITVLKQHVP